MKVQEYDTMGIDSTRNKFSKTHDKYSSLGQDSVQHNPNFSKTHNMPVLKFNTSSFADNAPLRSSRQFYGENTNLRSSRGYSNYGNTDRQLRS